MAPSNSDKADGGDFYGAAPYIAREGLIMRRAGVQSNYGDIQVQVEDLEQGLLDAGVTDLRKQVHRLRNVSQESEAEVKYHNNFIIIKLQKTLAKAQAGLTNNMRRLKLSLIHDGSDYVKHVVLFAVVCFIVLYLWFRFSGK